MESGTNLQLTGGKGTSISAMFASMLHGVYHVFCFLPIVMGPPLECLNLLSRDGMCLHLLFNLSFVHD